MGNCMKTSRKYGHNMEYAEFDRYFDREFADDMTSVDFGFEDHDGTASSHSHLSDALGSEDSDSTGCSSMDSERSQRRYLPGNGECNQGPNSEILEDISDGSLQSVKMNNFYDDEYGIYLEEDDSDQMEEFDSITDSYGSNVGSLYD